MKLFKKIFIHSWYHYLIAFVITIAITLIYLFTRGFEYYINYYAGLQTGSAVTIFFGLLLLVAYLGAFDTFGYGIHALFKRDREKYKDLYDYTNKKSATRKSKNLIFMPYITVGTFLLIISLILMLFR